MANMILVQQYFSHIGISILLHSGLNPAQHFWLSTRFSCCLKMKSVENILGYIREQFYRFSRGCKPRENIWPLSLKLKQWGHANVYYQQQCSSVCNNAHITTKTFWYPFGKKSVSWHVCDVLHWWIFSDFVVAILPQTYTIQSKIEHI